MHIYNPLTVFDPIVLIHYTHMTHMYSQLASSLAFNVASRSSRGLHSGWVEYVTSC
jgi:hypothetical protein